MDKELKKAFTEMTRDADPDRVQDAVRKRIGMRNMAERPAGTKWIPGGYRKTMRAVLSAAMVLVLAVTVYAAVQKLLTVILPEEGPYDVVVQMPEDAGEMIALPEEKREQLQAYVLTQEDMRNGRIREKQKNFNTWAEAAAWLDCGLLTSDLLTETENDTWGNVRLRVYGDVYPELDRNASISLSGGLEHPELTREGNALLMVTIPLSGDWENYGARTIYVTDKVYEQDETVELHINEHEKVSAGELVTQYTTTSGIPVEIAVLTVPWASAVLEDGMAVGTEFRDSTEVHVYFLHEGILYEYTFSAPDVESGVETAKAIAESMQ